jgi:hypothetical protein
VVWSAIPQAVFPRLGAEKADTEGIVDHLRAIQDVEVAMLLTETGDGQVRASLRSHGVVDMAAVDTAANGSASSERSGAWVDDANPRRQGRLDVGSDACDRTSGALVFPVQWMIGSQKGARVRWPRGGREGRAP